MATEATEVSENLKKFLIADYADDTDLGNAQRFTIKYYKPHDFI